jgi:hypothetical protein
VDLGALRAISDVGVALVCLSVLAVFGYKLLREYIDGLKADKVALAKDRDDWRSIAESGVAAFERLTDQLGIEPMVKPSARPKRPNG